MARERRVWYPSVPGPGAVLTLDPEEAHHVTQVLRLRAGDALHVFDGEGREWDAVVVESDRTGARVRIGPERTDPVDPDLRIVLYQALCRPDRMEWAIQKATEVGVSAIVPVTTARCEGGAPPPDRIDRWRRIAREACKQSGRRRVPEIGAPTAIPPKVPEGTVGWMLVPAAWARPLGSLLDEPPRGAVWLLVGPEGGLDAEEIQDLATGGWLGGSLGPRILRAETAGVVACALVLHAWGDLGPR